MYIKKIGRWVVADIPTMIGFDTIPNWIGITSYERGEQGNYTLPRKGWAYFCAGISTWICNVREGPNIAPPPRFCSKRKSLIDGDNGQKVLVKHLGKSYNLP